MSSVDFKPLQDKLRLAARVKTEVTQKAFDFWVKTTPVATGNARNSTRLNQGVIEARYPYAFVLDAGRGYRDGQMRGSRQAPDGMTKPTTDFVERQVNQYISQIGRK